MFNALADLAKNNGENAMKVLADQLLNAVEQLSDAVADLDRAVAKQGKSTGGFGDAVSGAIDKFKEVVTGNTKKVEAMTPKAGNNADIIEAIQDLEDTLVASGIKIKSGAY
jgi:cell division septum initiation protein DivIVA